MERKESNQPYVRYFPKLSSTKLRIFHWLTKLPLWYLISIKATITICCSNRSIGGLWDDFVSSFVLKQIIHTWDISMSKTCTMVGAGWHGNIQFLQNYKRIKVNDCMNLIRAILLDVVLSIYFGLEVPCCRIEVQSLLVWGQKPSKTLESYAASRDMMLMYNNRYLSIFLTFAIDCIMVMIIIAIIIIITHLTLWSRIHLSIYLSIYLFIYLSIYLSLGYPIQV
jgi:hypothetical protein